MENIELINIWKEQNTKIEKALAINQWLLKETINNKAKTSLQSLIRFKTLGIIAFGLHIGVCFHQLFLCLELFYHFSFGNRLGEYKRFGRLHQTYRLDQ